MKQREFVKIVELPKKGAIIKAEEFLSEIDYMQATEETLYIIEQHRQEFVHEIRNENIEFLFTTQSKTNLAWELHDMIITVLKKFDFIINKLEEQLHNLPNNDYVIRDIINRLCTN